MATISSKGCDQGDSLKTICYADYALLLEYAEVGYDYDTIVALFKVKIDYTNQKYLTCEQQKTYLLEINKEMRKYIEGIERRLKDADKKAKKMKAIAYPSILANAILLLIIIVK